GGEEEHAEADPERGADVDLVPQALDLVDDAGDLPGDVLFDLLAEAGTLVGLAERLMDRGPAELAVVADGRGGLGQEAVVLLESEKHLVVVDPQADRLGVALLDLHLVQLPLAEGG